MAIELHFICPCGAIVDSYIDGPEPPSSADIAQEVAKEWWKTLVCDGCTKDFEVHVARSVDGTDLEVAGAIDLNWEFSPVEQDEELLWEIEFNEQVELYKKVASDVILLLSSDYPQGAAFTFHCMLYAQVVTAVEAYLSGVFIHNVLMRLRVRSLMTTSGPGQARSEDGITVPVLSCET